MKNKIELPMMFARTGVVAKVVAVSLGVLGSLALFTCVVPELRESHERFQIAMLILFVASLNLRMNTLQNMKKLHVAKFQETCTLIDQQEH